MAVKLCQTLIGPAALLILALPALLNAQLPGPAGREVFALMKSEPLLTAALIFENSAASYNERVDREFPQTPREQRPYATARELARLTGETIKAYRAGGDPRDVEELTSLLPVEAPLEEKVAFFELMVKTYLEQPSAEP